MPCVGSSLLVYEGAPLSSRLDLHLASGKGRPVHAQSPR